MKAKFEYFTLILIICLYYVGKIDIPTLVYIRVFVTSVDFLKDVGAYISSKRDFQSLEEYESTFFCGCPCLYGLY
jgi:hypothetical protein